MRNINISAKEFADNVFGPEDERKERCIHCGYVWYQICYQDEVCNACQQKKLPGRSVIVRRAHWKIALILCLVVIFSLAVMSLIIN
jgi:hypothetical protein